MTSPANDKKLNKEQKEAIHHGTGPLLIIAGAGTGKTTVITERIVHLIEEKEVKPQQILALTFTEKASQEMLERVDIAMPYGYTQMWISTFHSFCDRILRLEAFHVGLDPKYKLMTEAVTVQFIRKHLFDFNLKYFRPLGNPTKFITGMLQHFSRLQDEDIMPDQYLDWAKSQMTNDQSGADEKMEAEKWMELASAYKTYEELKIKEGRMDYGDLIAKVLWLFRERPNLLKVYREQFQYVLVDEFQDTNIAQYELIKLLVPSSRAANITVVGDDSQCLPPNAKISTLDGLKEIKDIKKGNKVLTAIGKGHTSISKVSKVFKRKRKARLLTLTIEDGKKLIVTDNHKLFCFLPPLSKSSEWHFVYLMHQENMGWRIGVTNHLSMRLRLEHHADRIFALGSYKTDVEARFYEAYFSAKYGIPTVPFLARPKQAISGVWLEKLFTDIDTRTNAKKLAEDFGLDLEAPVFAVDGVTRGVSKRVKVNLHMCYRNYRSKTNKEGFVGNPWVMHLIHIETSNKEIIKKIEDAGYQMQTAKKDKRLRLSTTSLREAWKIAEKLTEITGGIIDKKFAVGKFNYQHLVSRIVPASHVFPGMCLPILVGKHIEYRMVVSREEEIKELETYDLEIEKTHNFIADGIVVHNSIYKFRGAAISNILYFKDDYPNAKMVVLTKNYRSTQTILDASYKLIQNNNPDTLESQLGITKNLVSVKKPKGGDIVEFIHEDRVENEAEEVAKMISSLLTVHGSQYTYGDIAILVRANNHAEAFIRSFQRHGIPYQFLGPGKLFRQPEIVDLISYLKTLYDFEDSVAFYKVLSIDYFDIKARDIIKITNYAKKLNLALFEACEKVEDMFVDEETKRKVTKLVGIINSHLKRVKSETAGQLLYYFLSDTGLMQKLLSPDNPDSEKRATNIGKFFDKLKTYEAEHEDATVTQVVDWIDLSMELGESPLSTDVDWSKVNAVNILTVHGSKGLEFPVVFLVNLVSQRFPTNERREQIPIPDEIIKEVLPVGDYHMQEERRLFYVGLTRAKNKLFLTAADYYGEGKREKKLSPFIFEALGDEALAAEHTQKPPGVQLSFLDYKPNENIEQRTKNKEQFHVDYLSYSQIETFQTCPLHYKLRYIYKIPTPPSAALSFGSSMHSAMQTFYQKLKNGEKASEKLITACLDESWINEGYKGKDHERQTMDAGYNYLKGFLIGDGYIDGKHPIALEQNFLLPLNHIEGERPLKVGGKIDRVDELADGVIEIIDYKTGRIPEQKEVDKNMQMTFYALAAHFMKEVPYGKKVEEIKLSLYYFEEQKKMSTTRTMDQLMDTVNEIYKVRKEIEESEFKCYGHIFCENCEFSLFCKMEGEK